ncbi:hypothetical protein [Lysobacter changpingensis]|uniref:hypothetical protein n=1 Tax=Lysobacter changpingensis TaxID=2792784 RepID=UPI001A900354|nr:hypothetical protein [Lysobacter changpingensis]
MRRRLARVGALLLACTLTCGMAMAQTQADAAVPAQDGKPGMRALLHDPKDGRFAMSRGLLDRKGFLPAPIIVSDPAVGYGGGLALTFFHRPAGGRAGRLSPRRPHLGRHNDFGEAPSQVAKDAGVRYKIASVLGLYTGVDYAWGPEDETFYIQVGSAWR